MTFPVVNKTVMKFHRWLFTFKVSISSHFNCKFQKWRSFHFHITFLCLHFSVSYTCTFHVKASIKVLTFESSVLSFKWPISTVFKFLRNYLFTIFLIINFYSEGKSLCSYIFTYHFVYRCNANATFINYIVQLNISTINIFSYDFFTSCCYNFLFSFSFTNVDCIFC